MVKVQLPNEKETKIENDMKKLHSQLDDLVEPNIRGRKINAEIRKKYPLSDELGLHRKALVAIESWAKNQGCELPPEIENYLNYVETVKNQIK